MRRLASVAVAGLVLALAAPAGALAQGEPVGGVLIGTNSDGLSPAGSVSCSVQCIAVNTGIGGQVETNTDLTGTITRWQAVFSGPGVAEFTVLTPVSGTPGAYTVSNTQQFQVAAAGYATFSASQPIQPGDVIGYTVNAGAAAPLAYATVPQGGVATLTPAAGSGSVPTWTVTPYASGSALMMQALVSNATETPTALGCKVPRVIGKTVSQARRALKKAGCTLGAIKTKRVRGKTSRPRVVSQSLKPGTQTTTETGTQIAVVVANTRR
jgi:hypothetical protein